MTTVFDPDLPDPGSVVVRDAATVLLLRDGTDGIEVCMMLRNINSDFVGGAYVFPGGAVDPEDSAAEALELCVGRDDVTASALVGVDRAGLSFWVAAIRESFEEAGILMARHDDGGPLHIGAGDMTRRFADHRLSVDGGHRLIAEVFRDEDLRFDAGGLHCFSRWITPLGGHRRYDTRFFVAAAPEDQEVIHDDHELVASRWITPTEALRQQDAGEMVMIFPTVRTLVAMQRFERTTDVLEWAAALTRVPAWLPTVSTNGRRSVIEMAEGPEGVGGRYDADSGRPL